MTDQRKTTRKILKVKAVLALEGQAPIFGKTSDIGMSGVSVTAPDPVPVGEAGQLQFDLLIDGKVTPMRMRTRVTHCIFGGGEFKVGLQFLGLDAQATTGLTRFLH